LQIRLRAAVVAALLVSTSCTGAGVSPGGAGAYEFSPESKGHHLSGSSPIQHVVIMIQENRSFDDFFATFPGADGTTYGCIKGRGRVTASRPHRQSGSYDCPSGDTVQQLSEGDLISDSLGHEYFSFKKEYDNGRMDGFPDVKRAIGKGHNVRAGTYPYQYVNPQEIAPYWQIAADWVLADHMFTTQGSSSFTAHQDFIAGGTPVGNDNVINFPMPSSWGCTARAGTVTDLITQKGGFLRGKGPYPCFTYETIRDLLDAQGLTWLYFANTSGSYVWNAFDAIKAVREGPEWSTNIVIPETDIFQYITYGELPNVTYITPDSGTSDHPGASNDEGPEWIASVVNAIGDSSYWPSTVIVVVWDEWGGLFDHVPPPQLDGQGLGPRIPMLIVSPYDRETTPSTPGYISHTQYEDGSILKFIEENWNLGSLGTSDQRANSIGDCFDFSQPARNFIPVASSLGIDYFARHYKPSTAPIDDY
jgi:phospholipase C